MLQVVVYRLDNSKRSVSMLEKLVGKNISAINVKTIKKLLRFR